MSLLCYFLLFAEKYYFKVPSLRNITLTSPYFHNGSVVKLEEAVRIMGKAQLNKDLTNHEISSLVTFLNTLTGLIFTETFFGHFEGTYFRGIWKFKYLEGINFRGMEKFAFFLGINFHGSSKFCAKFLQEIVIQRYLTTRYIYSQIFLCFTFHHQLKYKRYP